MKVVLMKLTGNFAEMTAELAARLWDASETPGGEHYLVSHIPAEHHRNKKRRKYSGNGKKSSS